MAFYERFSQLMDEKQVSAYKIFKDTGIQQSMLGRWRKGEQEPSLQYASQLADYFDCSVDYLLGRTDNPLVNRAPVGAIEAPTQEGEREVVFEMPIAARGKKAGTGGVGSVPTTEAEEERLAEYLKNSVGEAEKKGL